MKLDEHLGPDQYLEKKQFQLQQIFFPLKFTLFMEVNYSTMHHLFLTALKRII